MERGRFGSRRKEMAGRAPQSFFLRALPVQDRAVTSSRRSVFLIWLNLSILFFTGSPAAAMDDGFEFSRHVKSRYFTIYLKDGVDTDRLAMRIAVPAGTAI